MRQPPWHPPELRLEAQPDGSWEMRPEEAPDRVRCDFCALPEPSVDYDCDDFRTGFLVVDEAVQEHWSSGGFIACHRCAHLIDQGRYALLVARMTRRWNEQHPETPTDGESFISVVAGFARHRKGPGRSYTPKGGSA